MNNVRLRRLQSDYEAIRQLIHQHPHIAIQGVTGNPPERYRLMLTVRSLRQSGLSLSFVESHDLEIRLPHGYPGEPPMCRMLTPVFHPNIAPHAVCIGDHWTAAESLDRLIMRVCEMLAYQSYNTKSPLNGEAAQWVEDNLDRLPLDNTDFFLDLETTLPSRPATQLHCDNCPSYTEPFVTCAGGHLLCGDCVIFCENCQSVLCLVCGTLKCTRCAAHDLADKRAATAQLHCGNCTSHSEPFVICTEGHLICGDCVILCERCQSVLCLICGTLRCICCIIPDLAEETGSPPI